MIGPFLYQHLNGEGSVPLTMAEALRRAAAQFREYEASHRAQADETHRAACRAAIMGPDSERDRLNLETDSRIAKAARNREMAEMCEAALTETALQDKEIVKRVSEFVRVVKLRPNALIRQEGRTIKVSDLEALLRLAGELEAAHAIGRLLLERAEARATQAEGELERAQGVLKDARRRLLSRGDNFGARLITDFLTTLKGKSNVEGDGA